MEKLRECVNSEPIPLIRQARNYRSTRLTNKAITDFEKATRAATETVKNSINDKEVESEIVIDQGAKNDYSIHDQSNDYSNTLQAKLATKIEKISDICFTTGGIEFQIQIKYEKHGNSFLYKIEYADDHSRSAASKQKKLIIIISQEHEICTSALNTSNQKLTDLLLMIITLVITEILLTVSGNIFARFISKGFNEQLAIITNTVREYAN